MTRPPSARLLGLALPVLGLDGQLPVDHVDGVSPEAIAQNVRAARTLRRATFPLTALREAGTRGSVCVHRDTSPRSGERGALTFVLDTGAEHQVLLLTHTTWQGRPNGMFPGDALLAVADPGHLTGHRYSSEFNLLGDPITVRRRMVRSTMAALAPQLWQKSVASAPGCRMSLTRARAESSLILHFDGPTGPLLAHASEDGHLSGLTQLVGHGWSSSWHTGTGSFGRFLTREFTDALGAESISDVTGPFMTRLKAAALAALGLDRKESS